MSREDVIAWAMMPLNEYDTGKIKYGTHKMAFYKPPITYKGNEMRELKNEIACVTILDPIQFKQSLKEMNKAARPQSAKSE